MKKIILSAVAVASLAIASEQPYELGLTLGGTAPQDSLKLENHKNIGIRFGMKNDYFLENIYDTLEFSYERSNGVEYENTTLDTDINRYAVNMLHHYDGFQSVRPYALAGLGYEDFSDEYGKVNDSIALNLGVGLKYALSNSFNLRAEIRDHVNLQKSIEQEFIYTVGLGYTFGYDAPKKIEEIKEKVEEVKQKVIAPVVLDEDKDGILDKDDSCIGTPSKYSVDEIGCPKDDDKDGVFNEDDICLETVANETVDVDGCALDTDKDGVKDSSDKCLDTPKGASVDALGCALDSDKDGVIDLNDKCPNTLSEFTVDSVGCAANFTFEVKFDTNKDIVKDEYNAVLEKFVKFMNMMPTYKAQIQGHTDSMGEESYNMSLSTKRAKAVMDKLINLGIDVNRLSSEGFGSKQPVASNDTYSGKLKNRRVEAKLIK